MTVEQGRIAVALEKLNKIVRDPGLTAEMPSLFSYYYKRSGTLTLAGLKRYLLESAAIFDLCQMKGKPVLDVGCGFGLRLICYSLLGSGPCTGIDISEEMACGAQVLLKRFPDLAVKICQADFLTYPFKPCSFTVVTLIEAISHIRDSRLLLEQVLAVLADNGILYIQDGNNDLLITSRIRIRREWHRSEYGPLDEDMVRDGRAVDRTPNLEGRRRIIRKSFPSLDDKITSDLATKTRGLWGEEIIQAVEQLLETGETSLEPTFPWRNPYTGEYPELGFNPFKLMSELESMGFQSGLVPPISAITECASPNRLKRVWAHVRSPFLKRVPKRLLPFVCGSFAISARKSQMNGRT